MGRKAFFILSFLALLFLTFVFSYFPIQDSDTFMYLTLGRWYWEYGSFPTQDPFLYSMTYDWNILHEWATHLLFYAFYKWQGFVGLVAFKSILVSLILCAPVFIAVRLRYFSALPFLLTLLALFSASHRFTERASLFSDFFIVAVLAILLLEYHKPNKLKYALPFIFLFWTQLHPGYHVGLLFLFMLVGIQIFGSTGEFIAKPKSVGRLWVVAVLSTLATFISPEGFSGFSKPFKVFFDPHWQVFSKYYSEWEPTYFSSYRGTLELKMFTALSIAVFFLLMQLFLKSRLRRPIFEFLIFAALFGLGISKARFMATSAYGLATLGSFVCAQLFFVRELIKPHLKTSFLLYFVFLASAVGLGFQTYQNGYSWAAGHRHWKNVLLNPIDRRHQPVDAVKYLQHRFPLKGNIFNDHAFGCYLTWAWNGNPKIYYHGFVDNPEFYLNGYRRIAKSKEDFYDIVNRNKIRYFLLEPLNPPPPHYIFLQSDDRWKKIYEDSSALIYERQ